MYLIRAEAENEKPTGNFANALADLNFIRRTSGKLPTSTLTEASSDAAYVDELLYNRRYSLIWEGGHRWIDMRRYGLLASLPRDRPGDIVIPYAAITDAECIARDPDPPGCTIPAPL